MASEREIFSLTGPSFLPPHLDWNNSQHRRSVAASLVQGVYTLERDRRQNRHGPQQAQAPPWWLSFNFRLVQTLVDSHDVSYFGAVYEFVHFHHCGGLGGPRPPQYVVAFRGTINSTGNREEDFKLNLHLIINNLHNSSRFRTGFDAVRGVVHHAGPASVWIAGHSLGSSLALLVGRQMAREDGVCLETYLFNPPFASPPIQSLASDRLGFGIRLANSVLTAGLAAAVDYAGRRSKDSGDDHFGVLSTWIPYLFINPSDPICSEYVGYFKHREDMEAIGAGRIGRLATKHSVGSLLLSAAGKKECEAMHLIPSAYLTVNVTPPRDFKEAHGIHQWWRQDLAFDYRYYQHR